MAQFSVVRQQNLFNKDLHEVVMIAETVTYLILLGQQVTFRLQRAK